MVKSATSFSQNGLRDWLIQRVSAVVIGIFAVTLMVNLFQHDTLNQAFWQDFFAHSAVKILSFVVMLSVLAHAWIGMWTVYTDYIKCSIIRLVFQVLTIIALLSFVVWTSVILWG